MVRIVLASASPRRQQLLQTLGLRFSIDPAGVDENEAPGPPDAVVRDLACRKALEVGRRHRECLVIGCDTLVFVDGRPLSKPESPAHAIECLNLLSGRTHSVWSGIAVVHTDARFQPARIESGARETQVQMRALSMMEIEAYVATGEPLDKAGGYGIQGKGALLVDSIVGDYFNVVGLPLTLLRELLLGFGVDLLRNG